jgi:hypothetical protein
MVPYSRQRWQPWPSLGLGVCPLMGFTLEAAEAQR